MKRKIVLCDLDGIVADLLTTWLELYYQDSGYRLRVDGVTDFDLHKIVPCGQEIYKYIRRPGIYDSLPLIDGAKETLERLNEIHDVIILSTPSRAPETASEKIYWCQRNLPFLNRRQIILASKKELVRGEFFIDDSPDHLKNWKEKNPGGKAITIAYPYNVDVRVDLMAKGFRDTKNAWSEIEAYIRKWS